MLVPSVAVVVVLFLLALHRLATFRRKIQGAPPGPKPWPLFGSVHLLARHETPLRAFAALAEIYGAVFSIRLGSSNCVVVNDLRHIKEVLVAKGANFGGRPDFLRFHKLFGGDRNNSLALCDWSSLQKTRRSIARTYCSPRFTSQQYDHVNKVASKEVAEMLKNIEIQDLSKGLALKPIVLMACANMFTEYMCSTSFGYKDDEFNKVVRIFDEIFWEINQGYLVDFVPWLLPFYTGHMNKLSNWAAEIRKFILKRIVDDHNKDLDENMEPRDFTDALLLHLKSDPTMNWQHIIFELEDFLGGHSAIGNLVMVVLAEVVKNNDDVQIRIQEEVDSVTKNERPVNLFDKELMPYTEATIWETLRVASSPIVPHVATVDTEIGDFSIAKDTVVFINNYTLNMGADYWSQPEKFKPERFLSNGKVSKPAHFIPFSTGRRTCIGQKLVQCFTFVILSNIFQRYDVRRSGSLSVLPGCVAVPPDCFKLTLKKRRNKD
ncbi:cytochrome P450 307a1-like [Onthophagus taurus]|uniref:cytochrome P450 307a1-like n=1 Tax=Onthophagus taurus TaxID=166361 RepID=UPI0039BE7A2F